MKHSFTLTTVVFEYIILNLYRKWIESVRIFRIDNELNLFECAVFRINHLKYINHRSKFISNSISTNSID